MVRGFGASSESNKGGSDPSKRVDVPETHDSKPASASHQGSENRVRERPVDLDYPRGT
jgi:hypothetical protein